jgi:UDP-2,3-diacylglucosamine pyrophosphatase LpxH
MAGKYAPGGESFRRGAKLTTIFVISDLHLGGAERFQICPARARERLARFITWAATQRKPDTDVHLVLNGDVVDFLAEEDDTGGFSAFADEQEAMRKFRRIAMDAGAVFDALRNFLESGGYLTVLLGNHDIELSLPSVRREFLARLGRAQVEFLTDNQALSIGPVVIEHGNRYDGWNMVNHNQLRQLRSHLSRREHAGQFAAQPGSELVARVMNPIKHEFAFVDLLKPETGAVVPILAVLNPDLWRSAAAALEERIAAWHRGRFTREGIPIVDDYVAAPVSADAKAAIELPPLLREPFTVAREFLDELAPQGDAISWKDNVVLLALLKAFRRWRAKAERSFTIEYEDEEYLGPARALAASFKVVVFGHTHLAKQVKFHDDSLYLNTGTWADLMRLPEDIYQNDPDRSVNALRKFLDQVKSNDIDAYRRQIATFARIDLGKENELRSAGVYFFDQDGCVSPLSSTGLQERLR